MKIRKLQVYSKPESMKQREWEKEFLNPIAYTELKRRGLTDRQIANFFGINYHAIVAFRKKNPQYGVRSGRSAS